MLRTASLFAALVAMQAPALAQDCDCQKVIGQCQGLVEVVRSFGSAKSFGAELMIHSSEKKCSKVEYYVDGTPYQTILANRNKEPESVFGTKPITGENVSFSACHVCASSEQKADKPEPKKQRIAEDADVTGTWRGSLAGRNAGPMTVNLTVSGNSLSGVMNMDGKSFTIISGSVNGSEISWVQGFIFGNVRWAGTLDRAAGTIRGTWTHPFNSDTFELTKAD